MSNSCQATRRQKDYIASVRRYTTIRMGSGGIVWANPPNTQCFDCRAFEDLLCAAFWLRFGSAGHDE
eukprot:4221721-Amphidinium_carterae.1